MPGNFKILSAFLEEIWELHCHRGHNCFLTNDELKMPFVTRWRMATNGKCRSSPVVTKRKLTNPIRHQMTNGDERKKRSSPNNERWRTQKKHSSPNDERRRTRKKHSSPKWRTVTNKKKSIRRQMTNGDERQKHDSTLSDERWRTMKAVRHKDKRWKLIVFIP